MSPRRLHHSSAANPRTPTTRPPLKGWSRRLRVSCPYCGVIPAPDHGCHWEPEAVAIREAARQAAGDAR
jgi:hypothetical protein